MKFSKFGDIQKTRNNDVSNLKMKAKEWDMNDAMM